MAYEGGYTSAVNSIARRDFEKAQTDISIEELQQYQKQQRDKQVEDAAAFQYLQNVMQPSQPAPGQASVPMQMPPPPTPRPAGLGAPGGAGAPPGPFGAPIAPPAGIGAPPGMPSQAPPAGAPPAPPMPPPSWMGPSPAAPPSLGGPAGIGGSPAGVSPVAGTSTPAGPPLPMTPPFIGAPPPMPGTGAAGGGSPMQPQEPPMPGTERIQPIPVDQIWAKIDANPSLSGSQKFQVMQKVLAVANQQNQQLLRSIHEKSLIQEAAAKAAKDTALALRAAREPPQKQSEAERIAAELENPDLPQSQRAALEQRLKALSFKKGMPGAGGGGGVGAGTGTGAEKSVEFIYPKGKDGLPDQTKDPIGTRGLTKDGKIVYKDTNGNVTTAAALGGGTPKEAKAAKIGVTNVVRQNIVKAGVKNSLDRLNEIEKKFPNTNTSAFFGQAAENPMSRAAYGIGRSAMQSEQKQADAMWASFIDEAIPVFTGGLRGSDAFRRFLIEQAPAPGDDAKTRAEKRRLIRANIEGTSKAFFNKFSSDPSMWAPGTTPADVTAVKEEGGIAEGESGANTDGAWKVEKVGK